MRSRDTFVRRVGMALGLSAMAVFAFLAVFYAGHVLLVAFAGFLLAIYFRALGDFLGKVLPIPGRWRVGIVLLVHLGAAVLFAWYAAPLLEEQSKELADQLPEAVQRLREYLGSQAWGRPVLSAIPDPATFTGEGGGRVMGVFTSGISFFVDIVVILIVGIYGALEPEAYRRGLLLLFPPRHRERALEVSVEATETLRHFLLGLFASATIIGVCSAVGLSLLDVPLPVLMGLLAGLLTFVPNIGPIVSVVPPALLALLQSPDRALWVLVLYAGLQFLESYVVTPIIQRRAVQLPPALLILAQVLLGVLGGTLGIAMAAPLTALTLVLTKELYVKEPEAVPEPDDDDGAKEESAEDAAPKDGAAKDADPQR
ncbi:MAG: AI-2E family transporter [Sandaracinus sp.]|nr:AI-2E family transporter [Sandaracinus sp.]